jgi:RNA polymerase sigma-70 factor (ECF subfamily)
MTSQSLEGDAFTNEVEPHLHVLYRGARRLTSDAQSADDLLQDTLERAFVNFGRYKPGTNLRAWLFRVLTNLRITEYRGLARRPQVRSLDVLAETAPRRSTCQRSIATPDVESDILARLGEEIHHAIDGLRDDFRVVVALADVEEYAYKDIATLLSVPLGTVASRLFRGRRQLQQVLTDRVCDAGRHSACA